MEKLTVAWGGGGVQNLNHIPYKRRHDLELNIDDKSKKL